MQSEFKPPTRDELVRIALDHLKEFHPKDYRQMQRDKSLQQWAENRADAAADYANSLLPSAWFSPIEAWNLAVRQELLETESD